MLMRTICGDDIDSAMTSAMHATLEALVCESIITQDQANDFGSAHFAKTIDDNSMWRWIRNRFGFDDKPRIVVCQVKANRLPSPKEIERALAR